MVSGELEGIVREEGRRRGEEEWAVSSEINPTLFETTILTLFGLCFDCDYHIVHCIAYVLLFPSTLI